MRHFGRVLRAFLVGAAVALVTAAGAGAAEPFGFWGGEYTTRTNERVRVFSSPSYPVDPTVNQGWADFVASLVHGPELASVSVYLAPPAEVRALCGGNPDVRGCYERGRIVALGEDAEVTARSVLMHEYGHHVAASRSNAPWPALGWGTKRWSSRLQVCRHARAKEWWPGAQGPLVYFYNPGEAFAEGYRLLNEQRLGIPLTPWRIVDPVFLPGPRALALLERDVVRPWRGNTTVTRAGRMTKRSLTVSVATPLDGELTASVTGAARLGSPELQLVCGQRVTKLRLVRTGAPGPFRLTVSRP